MTPKSEVKLFVAVLQVDREPWVGVYQKGQLPTWMKLVPDNIQLANVWGNKPSLFVRAFDFVHEAFRWNRAATRAVASFDALVGEYFRKRLPSEPVVDSSLGPLNLKIREPDCLLTLPLKELALFHYFLEHSNADFLYMTNTSSFVSLERLIEFAQGLPKSRVYGGSMKGSRSPFASGANRILSRDVVAYVRDNFHKWDFRFLDDVALGLLLRRENLFNPEIPSLTFASMQALNDAADKALHNAVHFRLKDERVNRRDDWLLMRRLHERLTTG